jgi:hypothetical protein
MTLFSSALHFHTCKLCVFVRIGDLERLTDRDEFIRLSGPAKVLTKAAASTHGCRP